MKITLFNSYSTEKVPPSTFEVVHIDRVYKNLPSSKEKGDYYTVVVLRSKKRTMSVYCALIYHAPNKMPKVGDLVEYPGDLM